MSEQKPATESGGKPAEKMQEKSPDKPPDKPLEKGGPKGPEPTRYGDWEIGGKCVDF